MKYALDDPEWKLVAAKAFGEQWGKRNLRTSE